MEKVKTRRGRLTTEQIFSDLKRTKAFIDNAKEPVRIWHLVTNAKKETTGFMSGPILKILVKNGIIKASQKSGYTWNPKIPVTMVLAQTVHLEWQKYKLRVFSKISKPVLPCSGHSVEPAKIKRVRKPKEMPKQESWFKRVVKAVFNIK